MSHSKVYPVPKHVQKTAYLNNDDYLRMYARSMENPEAFWGEMAEELLVWHKKWDAVKIVILQSHALNGLKVES